MIKLVVFDASSCAKIKFICKCGAEWELGVEPGVIGDGTG